MQVDPNRPLQVFLSSPFEEYRADTLTLEKWPLREMLGRFLRDAAYKTWIYEVEEKEAGSVNNPEYLISQGISSSDIVVVLLKTRPGRMIGSYPLEGVPFEIVKAAEKGIPVFLYVLGKDHEPRLTDYLALFSNRLFVVKRRHFMSDDDATCKSVLRDLNWFSVQKSRFRARCAPLNRDFRPEDLSSDVFEEHSSRIAEATSHLNYLSAVESVNRIPVLPNVVMSKHGKTVYARVLGQCGAVRANMMNFRSGMNAKLVSIKLYFEAGEIHDAFSEISALSGVCQMFERRRALQFNRLASGAINAGHPGLEAGILDSLGSILMSRNQFKEAATMFRRVIGISRTETPYIMTKLAYAEARAGGPKAISRARIFADEQILPFARETARDLPFAMKGSARLAIWDGDGPAALPLIAEARDFCVARGLFHPLKELAELESKVVMAA